MSSCDKQRVLNRGVGVASPAETRPPLELALDLQRTMLQMKGEYMTEDGRGVDYEELTSSDVFKRYESLAGELERCDPSKLDEDERKAFFISILY